MMRDTTAAAGGTADPFADQFPASYRESRERLLERVHALSTRHETLIDSRAIDERGPSGETLALDFVIFGARRPRQALVVSSGTHGVEGYAGAAVQQWMLDRLLPGLELDAQTAIVIQHANNPYGFAWHRRVNENNVDINRNFLRHFDPSLCSADYELLFECLNPADMDPERERQRLATIEAFVEQHGLRHFQQVFAEGQYKYPHGMQFGGHHLSASVAHLLQLAGDHLADSDRVMWLDFHTGLGEFAACEVITGAAIGSDEYRLANQVWPDRVKSATGGESISTPLNGVFSEGMPGALPARCRFAFGFPEYGTYPPERVFRAMRADNWLHRFGDLSDATGRAIKDEMLEAFSPADPRWQRQVVATGAALIEQALAWLPGARQRR
ncbi:MAG: DUF2817 domain-containing protein [Burkholderiales bacterium]|nr:MAG: DUF2817 domain-containing protein [Burkholderiales bacterium]